MKKSMVLLLGVLWANASWSQVKGVVKNEADGKPIQSAVIETSKGGKATTDENGKFSVPCESGMTISVSSNGSVLYSETVDDCNKNLEISINPDIQVLEESLVTWNANRDKISLNRPASITKLGIEEIKRGNGIFLMDAVNTSVPGVTMQSRTTSGGQQFNIRGYGNGARGTKGVSSNFDGQGTKVYLNGIPVTNAEGISIMDDIDFGSISRVDILKGPSGTVYGNAIAGVVNLYTNRPEKGEVSLQQNTVAGSYGLLRSTTTFAVGGDRSSLLVNYGYQSFNGFMPHTATKKGFANMIGQMEVNDKDRVSVYVGYSDGFDQRNGELTIDQYDSLDYSGNPEYIKNDAHSAVKTVRGGISNSFRIAKFLSNTSSIFGSSQLIDNSSAGGWNDVTNLSYGLRSTFDFYFKLGDKMALKGTTGIEAQRTGTTATAYKMGADSTDLDGYNTILSVKTIGETQSTATNIFSQWVLSLPMKFDFTAGIGYNRMDMSYTDRLWATSNNAPGNTVPKTYSATYSDMLSPTIALNKMILSNYSVYASYSIAYKAPVSSYFYIPQTGEVNTGLLPEKGAQIEVGAKGTAFGNRLNFTLAVFNTQITNKITAVTVQNPANTVTLYSYMVNGGGQNNTGVEVMLQGDFVKGKDKFFTEIKPFVNGTYSFFRYTDFRFETIGDDINGNDSTLVHDYSNLVVAGVPPLTINVGIDVATRVGLYANAYMNYRDAMFITSDNANEAKSYAVINAKIGFKREFGKFGLDAYAGAVNLTSQQYYNMVFVNQLPDAYIAQPREINFYGGLNLKYRF